MLWLVDFLSSELGKVEVIFVSIDGFREFPCPSPLSLVCVRLGGTGTGERLEVYHGCLPPDRIVPA